MIKTNFLGDEISKENVNYACIACITIDSVMRMEKKYSQVYLQLQNPVTKLRRERCLNS